jgi:hypothetical protein
MLLGVGQRTAVIITLIGVLLLSGGTCILPAQQATHRCCMDMSKSCGGVKADCCKASPQTPPATVTPVFPGLASMDAAREFVPSNGDSLSREILTAPVAPSQSPPSGNFILRI